MRQTSDNIANTNIDEIDSSYSLTNKTLDQPTNVVSNSTNEISTKKIFQSFAHRPARKSERNTLGKRSLSSYIIGQDNILKSNNNDSNSTKLLSKKDSASILIVRI